MEIIGQKTKFSNNLLGIIKTGKLENNRKKLPKQISLKQAMDEIFTKEKETIDYMFDKLKNE